MNSWDAWMTSRFENDFYLSSMIGENAAIT